MKAQRIKSAWHLIEDLPEYPPRLLLVLHEMARRLGPLGFGRMPLYLQHYVNGGGSLYAEAKAWRRAVNQTMQSLIKKPETYFALIKRQRLVGRALQHLAERILASDLRRPTSLKLLQNYQLVQKLIIELHFTRGPGWMVEQRDEAFSKYLMKELVTHIGKHRIKLNPVDVFTTLTMPSEQVRTGAEEIGLLRLAARPAGASRAALASHLKRYWYITYGTTGPGMTMTELRRRYLELRRGDPKKKLADKLKDQRLLITRQEQIAKALKPTRQLASMIKVAQLIAHGKAWSKEIQYHGHAACDRVCREIGRRYKISLRRVSSLTPGEFSRLVRQGARPADAELDQRWKNSWFSITDRDWHFLTNGELREFLKTNSLVQDSNIDSNIRELHGTPAVLGIAKGSVRIINLPKDMVKMRPGDILVSDMTNPEIVPAMRQAAAIVTNVGGLTCHAAIVSRELGIPCVIGTKIATKVLKDGDWVEVDANKGIVRKI